MVSSKVSSKTSAKRFLAICLSSTALALTAALADSPAHAATAIRPAASGCPNTWGDKNTLGFCEPYRHEVYAVCNNNHHVAASGPIAAYHWGYAYCVNYGGWSGRGWDQQL